jgi:hypothetical protein
MNPEGPRAWGRRYDRYCRQRAVCKMVEQLSGLPHRRAVRLWESKVAAEQKERDRIWESCRDEVVEQCINCQFVPCQYWTLPQREGQRKGAGDRGRKVVRLPECGVACSAGRYLTCSGAGACGYQVYTQENARQDAELALSGSSRWYGENVNILKVGANVLSVTEAQPRCNVLPVQVRESAGTRGQVLWD